MLYEVGTAFRVDRLPDLFQFCVACLAAETSAGEEGYAIMSLGPLRNLDDLAFAGNVQHCGVGTYGYENTKVR